MRATGHIPDRPSAVGSRAPFHRYAAARGLSSASLPTSTNNRPCLATSQGGPGIPDQDGTSSCTGHAARGAANTEAALAGAPIPLLSAVQPYLNALQAVRPPPNPDGSFAPLVDGGTEPSLVVAAGARGWCSAKTWGDEPASPATIVSEDPEHAALMMRAAEFQVAGAYFLPADPAQVLLGILTAFTAKKPVTWALPASGGAFNAYKGGILTGAMLAGYVGHYNFGVDFAWLGTAVQWSTFVTALQQGATATWQAMLSLLVLYGVNSWSEDWGESDVPSLAGGLYRLDGTAAGLLEDLAVWDVVQKGSEQ